MSTRPGTAQVRDLLVLLHAGPALVVDEDI
jgi:hypothetical protein